MPGYVFTLFALGTVADRAGRRSARRSARSRSSRSCSTPTSTCSAVRRSCRSRRRCSRPREGSACRAGGRCSRSRSRWRAGALGGAALALMEALADFGTVNLLGVHTFTDAIYRVWFIAFDRQAAMQLAALLVSVTLALLVLERLARGRARTTSRRPGRRDLDRATPRARRRGRHGRSAGARGVVVGAARPALGLGVRVDPRRPPWPRVRSGRAQQPSAVADERPAGERSRAPPRLWPARLRIAADGAGRSASPRSATGSPAR